MKTWPHPWPHAQQQEFIEHMVNGRQHSVYTITLLWECFLHRVTSSLIINFTSSWFYVIVTHFVDPMITNQSSVHVQYSTMHGAGAARPAGHMRAKSYLSHTHSTVHVLCKGYRGRAVGVARLRFRWGASLLSLDLFTRSPSSFM